MDHSPNEAVPSSDASTPHETNGAAPPEANGAHAASPNAPHHEAPPTGTASTDGRTRTQRAEEIVDHVASWVGNATSILGKRLVRFGSRIREEAEDFWAEAQSIRRGDKS